MKRYGAVMLALLVAVVLSGCADSHTTGTEKDVTIDVAITINQYAGNTGNASVSPPLDYRAAAGDTVQETANTADLPVDADLNLDDVGNPVTTVTEAVKKKAEAVLLDKAAEIAPADNDDAAAAVSEGDPAGQVDWWPLQPYKTTKSFAWLKHPGAYYGGQVTFVFGDGCGEFTVPDATKVWGEDGNPENIEQRYYFPGDHPGQDTNGGRASVFTAKGCYTDEVEIHYTAGG